MIDEIDREIILELQKDGRQSYIDLAKTLKVSETTVRNRVKQLIGDGMISVTAIPNLEAMGYGFMGIVGLQVRLADLHAIANQIAKHPNVCYLANVTGRFDFILIVLTRTAGEFAEFMESAISAIPSILRTETFVNLHIYKGQIIGLDTGNLISKLDISSLKKQV